MTIAAKQNPPRLRLEPIRSPYFRRETFPENSAAERQILGTVLRRGSVTQSSIVRETDISQQTVSRLIGRLLDRGSVRQGDRVASGKRGQLSTNIEIVPEYAYAFGAAILWDAIAVVLMDFSGRVIDRRITEVPVLTHDGVVDNLRAMQAELTEQWLGDESRVFGVGFSLPGTFIRGTGQVNTPLILDEWANLDIESVLENDLSLPVWIENDGNAAAIGESLVGVGRWARDFVYLYVATGLGGGIIVDGNLLRGEYGNAGEVAQLLPPGSYPHPNLELLFRLVKKHGIEVDSVTEMIHRFDPGWPGVEEWIAKVQDSLSLIASASAAILDPKAIVIGGRIPPKLAELVIPHIAIFDQERRLDPRPLPKIVAAEAAGDAAAIGAAALSFDSYFF
jgi:predicted NBD/HSP70 family sugar kinase